MKLSVVLSTHNEEANIEDCLKSVLAWADEIVVVDGSSTDRTVEIARKMGARVLETHNVPMFHINKQKAIDAAKGDWVLQLDADERLTMQLRREIDGAIKRRDVNGFWLPRKNYFLGRFLMKGGVYPDYTLRLYRRGKGRLPQKDVHEQAVVDGSTDYLHESLVHMADPTLGRYFERFNRYTDLIADEFETKHLGLSPVRFIQYLFIKPVVWFLWSYFRHKGFMDSWQGFMFSFFSACRFPVAYIKYLRNKYASRHH